MRDCGQKPVAVRGAGVYVSTLDTVRPSVKRNVEVWTLLSFRDGGTGGRSLPTAPGQCAAALPAGGRPCSLTQRCGRRPLDVRTRLV